MLKRRIQGLCGELRRALLVSEAFTFKRVAFSLKGFGAARPVFAPHDR